MNSIKKLPLQKLGYDFIPPELLDDNKNEFSQRNRQNKTARNYRNLTAKEIEILVKNGNRADEWDMILVSKAFNPHLVMNNILHGMIRIGKLEDFYLDFHDFRIPVGIYNSTIISCDLGDNIAIQNTAYLAHYIVGDEVIISNVSDMYTSYHSKFGNGIIKKSEKESDRIWMEIGNENGNRAVLPFDGMTSGDAWLWYKYREREALQKNLIKITENDIPLELGYYGTIGNRTVIRNCRIIKDVKIGSDAYIKGTNKLKNLTINSSPDEKTQIGEGVELVNGIIGYGCHIFYGVKAVRFVMQDQSNLKYGARLINSYLGSNSTISCCEVLNSLIFPGHEQHHNSSFLIASCLMGLSNIASGATIGSNHNSRSNDGEIVAGRGFWPGLNTSLKHCSRFASYSLIAKGSYPSELNIKLPFSLISNNEQNNELQVLPAYWFMYNMYALARNSWKYAARDKRTRKPQQLVFNYLSPDTLNEIFNALELLKKWSFNSPDYIKGNYSNPEQFFDDNDSPDFFGESMEASRRKVRIMKAGKAFSTYKEWINYYCIGRLGQYAVSQEKKWNDIDYLLPDAKRTQWINIGGQLIEENEIQNLIFLIESGSIQSWKQIHQFYSEQAKLYTNREASFAYACLTEITAKKTINWKYAVKQAIKTSEKICSLIEESRKKDYTSPFRNICFSSDEERDAVFGKLEDNSFIQQIKDDHYHFQSMLESLN